MRAGNAHAAVPKPAEQSIASAVSAFLQTHANDRELAAEATPLFDVFPSFWGDRSLPTFTSEGLAMNWHGADMRRIGARGLDELQPGDRQFDECHQTRHWLAPAEPSASKVPRLRPN
jgi:hypothetical protein